MLDDAKTTQSSERLADKYAVAIPKADSDENHGHNGPIQVSRGTYGAPKMQAEYIAAAKKVGWREVPDKSDVNSVNAVWRANRFISPEGKRQDAASCYIHPRVKDGKHPNLQILVETQVTRVLLDQNNDRAVGVEFRRNPRFDPDTSSKSFQSIRARKLVILAGGTCATPTILECSGIGEAQVLNRAGVPVLVDLPGVGSDYEDTRVRSTLMTLVMRFFTAHWEVRQTLWKRSTGFLGGIYRRFKGKCVLPRKRLTLWGPISGKRGMLSSKSIPRSR